ncbi:hypothetical protein HAX54_002262 [Datura stramonium]|uniref:Putative plant transposon protein domain-containing protein n=1 Tax=Datura stramonium TaxID=4076 RepID=A0ABS8T3L9_DATST|nr:hypothetical protein [Datura stramonium]
MEEYYLSFKKRHVIHAEAQFDVNSFRIAFPDIYQQIGLQDWGPFTIPVDLYFPELVWEFYASYKARQHYLQHNGSFATWPCLTLVWVCGLEVPVTPKAINSLYWVEPIPSHPIFNMKMDSKAQKFQWVSHIIAHGHPQWALSRGLINYHDLKYKARMWLDFVFARLIPSRSTSEVPIKVAILISCIMEGVQINVRELIAGQTVQANHVITLANKTYKDAQVLKRGKYIESEHSQPTMASSRTFEVPVRIAKAHTTSHPDLLMLAQKAKAPKNQLVKLAKAIPSMIHLAIQRALQLT